MGWHPLDCGPDRGQHRSCHSPHHPRASGKRAATSALDQEGDDTAPCHELPATHRGSLGPLKHTRAVLSLSSRLGGSPAASDTGPHPTPADPAKISQCSVLGTWWEQRCSVETQGVNLPRSRLGWIHRLPWPGGAAGASNQSTTTCPSRSLTPLWCSLRL